MKAWLAIFVLALSFLTSHSADGQLQGDLKSTVETHTCASQTIADSQRCAAGLRNRLRCTWMSFDGFPSDCTVSSLKYTTQLDCAFYTAKDWTITHHHSSQIVLGTNYYVTCVGLVEPTIAFYTVNIKGASQYSTYIDQYCPNPHHAVITKGEPEKAMVGSTSPTQVT